MQQLIILITVGTSIKDNFEKWLKNREKKLSENQLWACIENQTNDYNQFIREFTDNIPNVPKYPSAEIQSLWLFFQNEPAFENKGRTVKEIILYHTETEENTHKTGEIAAKAVRDIIDNVKQKYNIAIHADTTVRVESFQFKDINNREDFKAGVADLFDKIHKRIEEAHKASKLIILDITAGYKVLIPFTSLLSFLEREIRVIYGFEEANRIIDIPSLPLVWDYRTLDEFRVIFVGLGKEIENDTYELLYPKVKELFDYDPSIQKYRLNPFGELISEKYQKERYRRYGYGAPLLDRLENNSIRKRLEEKLDKWEHLWIGDQIPETVEHARYHSHRLLELAHYFLRFTKRRLSDEDLFLLISSIWLHDIGHSQLSYKLPNGYSLKIADFPTLVRKWHNFSSYQRIKEKNLLDDQNTSNSVALICKYHRNKMPVLRNALWKDKIFDQVSVDPLERVLDDEKFEVYGKEINKNKVLLIASILRFIDACDVQADRVITEEYREARESRTDEEIKYYLELLEERKTLWTNTSYSSKFDELYKRVKEFVEKHNNLKDKWKTMTIFRKKKMEDKAENIQDEIIENLKGVINNSLPERQQLIYSLGLLDKVVFKKEQEHHFIKHSGITVAYLGKEADGIAVHLVASENASKEDIEDVAKEIYFYEYQGGNKKGEIEKARSTEEVFRRNKIKVTKVYGIFGKKKKVLYPPLNSL